MKDKNELKLAEEDNRLQKIKEEEALFEHENLKVKLYLDDFKIKLKIITKQWEIN